MPTKSHRQQANEIQLIAWYKWEFLRRNPIYRKDYEGFMREFGDWFRRHGFWYDQTATWSRDQFQYFAKAIAPKAKIICERWQIDDPFSPDWEFTKRGTHDYKPNWEVFLPTECSKESAGRVWDIPRFLTNENEFVKSLPDFTAFRRGPTPPSHLELGVDLRHPLPVLLQLAQNRITSSKTNFDRKHPRPTNIAPAVRRRLDRYKVYLEVWDRRSCGEKYLSIGVSMFGSGLRVEQRAMDSFKAAQALIDGGYKELR